MINYKEVYYYLQSSLWNSGSSSIGWKQTIKNFVINPFYVFETKTIKKVIQVCITKIMDFKQ